MRGVLQAASQRFKCHVTEAARGGKETLEQVEPGYWLYAGPRENTALEQQIKDTIAGGTERGDYPLVSLGKHAPMPAGPA